MSKRRYTSKKFKQVDWKTVTDRLVGSRVILAVDVAKEDFYAAIMNERHEALVIFSWRHPEQTAEVVDQLRQLRQAHRLEAVLEPSGTYGDVLVWQLRQAQIPVYRVSPKRVHDAAEVYDGVPSLHDAKAASLIGRLHLEGISQPWQEQTEKRRTLKAVTTQLGLCKAREQAVCNRLEAQLSRHWPELPYLLDLGSVTLAALIGAYGDPASVAADPAGAVALMRRVGRSGLGEEKIQAILDSARHSLGVPMVDSERSFVQWLGNEASAIHREVRQIEQKIMQRVGQDSELSGQARAIGKVSAGVILAATGSAIDYPTTSSYIKAMGLNLKERSSGKHKGQLKITKRGPSVVRYYLYFAALRLIAHDPVVRQWYEVKSSRPGAIKNKCVIELMRKLAKALWHIARGESFDSNKLFNLKAVAAA